MKIFMAPTPFFFLLVRAYSRPLYENDRMVSTE